MTVIYTWHLLIKSFSSLLYHLLLCRSIVSSANIIHLNHFYIPAHILRCVLCLRRGLILDANFSCPSDAPSAAAISILRAPSQNAAVACAVLVFRVGSPRRDGAVIESPSAVVARLEICTSSRRRIGARSDVADEATEDGDGRGNDGDVGLGHGPYPVDRLGIQVYRRAEALG